MKWITSEIAVGCIEDLLNVDELRANCVDGILSLDWYPSFPPSHELAWRKQILIDGPGNSPADVEEALSHLQYLVGTSRRVLVICREGLSRSPFVVACHMARNEQRSFEDVVQQIASTTQIAIDPALTELGRDFSSSTSPG